MADMPECPVCIDTVSANTCCPKDVSSLWIGTTPEFELALYTMCFIHSLATGQERVQLMVAEYEVEIRSAHLDTLEYC